MRLYEVVGYAKDGALYCTDHRPTEPDSSVLLSEVDANCVCDECGERLDGEAPEVNEPTEGDYVMTDGRGGIEVSEHGYKWLGTFSSRTRAEQFIVEHMKREQFYPNVWFVSDHGNAHPVTLLD